MKNVKCYLRMYDALTVSKNGKPYCKANIELIGEPVGHKDCIRATLFTEMKEEELFELVRTNAQCLIDIEFDLTAGYKNPNQLYNDILFYNLRKS